MTEPMSRVGAEECAGGVCITCSDQAVRVTVLEICDGPGGAAGHLALVDTGVGVEEVSVALVDVVVGEDVLVHAGEAIAALGPA